MDEGLAPHAAVCTASLLVLNFFVIFWFIYFFILISFWMGKIIIITVESEQRNWWKIRFSTTQPTMITDISVFQISFSSYEIRPSIFHPWNENHVRIFRPDINARVWDAMFHFTRAEPRLTIFMLGCWKSMSCSRHEGTDDLYWRQLMI